MPDITRLINEWWLLQRSRRPSDPKSRQQTLTNSPRISEMDFWAEQAASGEDRSYVRPRKGASRCGQPTTPRQ